MLDHRLESLEGRSLLSAAVLLSGMPAPGADAHDRGAAVADEVAGGGGGGGGGMYDFRRGVDDAVYEEAAPGEDGGDYGEWDGGLFDGSGLRALGGEEEVDDESHPWIGLGEVIDAADEPVVQEDGSVTAPTAHDTASAVTLAHRPDAGTPVWLDDAETDEDAGIDTPGANQGGGADVRFSFEDGSEVPSYRDLAL